MQKALLKRKKKQKKKSSDFSGIKSIKLVLGSILV